jgi:hypothetical protein
VFELSSFRVKTERLIYFEVSVIMGVRKMGVEYKFVTEELQDKLGVVKAKVFVEFTPELVRELAKRKIRFEISDNELHIRSDLSWDYRDGVIDILRKAAIDKIARENRDVDTIVTEFGVELDVGDIDFSKIDKLYNEELAKEQEREKQKNLLAKVKTILRELNKQRIVSDLYDMGDYVKAELVDGTKLSYGLTDNLESAIQSLESLDKVQILMRVIEKLKQEIKELEKEKENLREKILKEIANAGSFTIKKEREITYRVEEEGEDC